MPLFRMYLANTHGQKLSGWTSIAAKDLREAKAIYRKLMLEKKVDLSCSEILAEI